MRDGNNPREGQSTTAGSTESAADSAPAPQPSVPDVSRPRDLSGEPASVHVIVAGERTRIVISGEIDADLAPDLMEATTDAEVTGLPIEVDAQHVTFMDSSGIAFLARLASRSGERVRVLRAPDAVRFLLEVTHIGELLDLVDDDVPAPVTAPVTAGTHPAPAIVASDEQAAPPGPDGAA